MITRLESTTSSCYPLKYDSMKQIKPWLAKVIAVGCGLATTGAAQADTTITTFDDFWSDALYASWAAANGGIENPGPTSYSITATGYGSNYKYIGVIDATGETTVELMVTISGPPAADGHIGPIISLVDGDGTYLNYAWFGQLLGSHTLTMPLASPTWQSAAGSTNGLDLATLSHMHMQVDPGGFGTAGAYTVTWENLRLTGATGPVIQITSHSYNPTSKEFALTWSSVAGKNYTVLQSATVGGTYNPLLTDVASGGTSTMTTVTMPAGDSGFLRIQEQP
jgi:hypothetical protein